MKLFVFELGMHGDGSLKYYEDVVSSLFKGCCDYDIDVNHCVIKTQRYTKKTYQVMNPLSVADIRKLRNFCHAYGFKFMCSAHDIDALKEVESLTDIIKVQFNKTIDNQYVRYVGKNCSRFKPIVFSYNSVSFNYKKFVKKYGFNSPYGVFCYPAYPTRYDWIVWEHKIADYDGLSLHIHHEDVKKFYDLFKKHKFRYLEIHTTALNENNLVKVPGDFTSSVTLNEAVMLADAFFHEEVETQE